MIQIKTYDTFDCPKFKMVGYMIANLDPIIWHAHVKTIERVYMNSRVRFYRLLMESDEEHNQLADEHEEYWADRRPAESSDEESGDCMLTSDMANWVRHGRFWIEKEWVWRVFRVVQA